MGKEQKKGVKGIAAHYMTRNKAVRTLQISLKDFRRICILKGIYPRDPKKKKSGKDKTYYHKKDIKFLSHEPLLMKFRELKTFLKKQKKAQVKKDTARMQNLQKTRPKMTLDHLVKERYPTFVDALRDMDDPLCMLNLFNSLPVHLTRDHKPEMVALCARLTREFENYVFRTKALRKVFVSIKGMYYQASVQGQNITWLVPHKFNQVIPKDVDIRIMLTFLEFYLTMVKFTQFKLYHDIELKYPPVSDDLALARRAGLQALKVESLSNAKSAPAAEARSIAEPVDQEEQDRVSELVKDVVSQLGDNEDEDDKAIDEAKAEEEAEQALDNFSKLDKSQLSPEELEKMQYSELFAGLTFLLSREVPMDSLEFVILCGSGNVIRQDQLTEEELRNTIITHHVMDRPSLKRRVLSREYVQPQWVYDSFNSKALLPTEPYGPGVTVPPHLSPFVDDEAEGYVPQQRKVLEEWGAQGKKLAGDKKPTEEDEDEDEEDLEEAYEKDLEKERAGLSYSQTQPDAEDEGDFDDEGDEDEGDEGDEGDLVADSEDEEEEVAPAPVSRAAKRKLEEKDLSKIMMNKKEARLYSRIHYGIKKKADEVAKLESKRRKINKKKSK